jgi:hypothetical protein
MDETGPADKTPDNEQPPAAAENATPDPGVAEPAGSGSDASDAPEVADAGEPAESGTEPKTRRGLSRGALIGIIIAAVVVVVIAIVVIVVWSNAAKAQAAREDAAASVSQYLTAVAASDAGAAVAQLSDTSTLDRTLLTDAVLKASNTAAPLTAIAVVTPTGDSGNADSMGVAASYKLGATAVSAQFAVHKSSAGTWLITDGTGRVSASIDGFTGMTLLINGVKLAGSSELDAFPGTYTLTTTTSGFTVTGQNSVTVKDAATAVSLASAKPQLTSAGLQTYRFAIDKDVKGCISSKHLKTGCGLTLPSKLADGTTLVDGTVQRSLPSATKAALAAVKPNAAASDGVKLATDGIGAVNVTVRCVKGGTKGTCQIANGSATYLRGPAVDMSKVPPVVTWPAQ